MKPSPRAAAPTAEVVEKIATLAKLKFSEEVRERYTKKFHAVLAYIETLNELDDGLAVQTIAAVPETCAAAESTTTELRADHTIASRHAADIVNLAPEKEGPYFLVPKVIDS